MTKYCFKTCLGICSPSETLEILYVQFYFLFLILILRSEFCLLCEAYCREVFEQLKDLWQYNESRSRYLDCHTYLRFSFLSSQSCDGSVLKI